MWPEALMYESSQRFLLKALHEAANEIGRQFYQLSDDQLDQREGVDGWSLRQLCWHFRDAEQDFSSRIEAILRATREPRLAAIDVDLLVAERPYDRMPVDTPLTEFARLRSRNCYALGDLWEDDWGKAGIHPYRGRITLADIAHEMNEHDLEHIWQIKRTRESAAMGSGSLRRAR